jgi:hypothetical protein
MTQAGDDGGMMILEKAPNLTERGEVLDLHSVQRSDGDAGATVEFVVFFDGGEWAVFLGSFPDGLSINQKLHVVDPGFAGSHDERSEV